MLRDIGMSCDNNVLRVWSGLEVDTFIADGKATRADDCIDYYGYQNEGRFLDGDTGVTLG
ncbi:MAG: hypothetical protein ACSLE9_18810 [Burkholderiaceae bacterium]